MYVRKIKILLDSGVGVSIAHKDVLQKRHKIIKQKRISGLLW